MLFEIKINLRCNERVVTGYFIYPSNFLKVSRTASQKNLKIISHVMIKSQVFVTTSITKNREILDRYLLP